MEPLRIKSSYSPPHVARASSQEQGVSRETVEQLERDGFAFSWRSKWHMPWSDPIRPMSAEEVVSTLARGETERLSVSAPEQLTLPVRSRQDLHELASLAGHGDQAAKLQQDLRFLAEQGFRFWAHRGEEQGEVGLYGAYNALTDPNHGLSKLTARRGELSLPVGQTTPRALRERIEELGDLASVQALMALGQKTGERAALLDLALEKTSVEPLGKIDPSLSSQARVALADRLFANPKADLSELSQAPLPAADELKVAQKALQERRTDPLTERLLADDQIHQSTRLMVARATLAGTVEPDLAKRASGWMQSLCDSNTNQGWSDAARVGQAACECLPDNLSAQVALSVEPLKHPGSQVRLYRAALDQPAATGPELAAQGHELSEGLRGTGYDHAWSDAAKVGRAFVKELAQRPEFALSAQAALGAEAMKAPGSFTRVYEAVMAAPGRSPEQVAALGRELSVTLRGTTYESAWQDADKLGRAFVETLANCPETAPVMGVALRAQGLEAPGSRTRLYEAVLGAPLASTPEELGKLGRDLSIELRGTTYKCAWQDADRAGRAFVEALAELPEGVAARAALRPELAAPGSRTRTYEAVLAQPTVNDPVALGALGNSISVELRGTTYDCAWKDSRKAGLAFVEGLQEFPATRNLALAVASAAPTAAPGSDVRLYEAVLADPLCTDLAAMGQRVADSIPASYSSRVADQAAVRATLQSAASTAGLDEQNLEFLASVTLGTGPGARKALGKALSQFSTRPGQAAVSAVNTLRQAGDESWRELAVNCLARLQPEKAIADPEKAAALLEVTNLLEPTSTGELKTEQEQVVINDYAVAVRQD
ncbi:MAG: hypothetical protein AB7S38_35450 [Vulcanimicrobiota bacterium]